MEYKYATLFGGAVNNTETKEYKETILIGELLAEKNYIVKNGGYRGLMEAVSKGVSNRNGKTIGYTCKSFGYTKGNEFLSETIVCNDIFERLKNLIDNTELFIVQRGGLGTLSELFLVLDIYRKYKTDIPKTILIGDFWNNIWNEICKEMVSEKESKLITIVKDFNELRSII